MSEFLDDSFDSEDSNEDLNLSVQSIQSCNQVWMRKEQSKSQMIDRQMYRKYPYNTSGVIHGWYQNCKIYGNCFLISDLLAVTSAHLFCFTTKELKLKYVASAQFTSWAMGYENPVKIKIKNFKIDTKYQQIEKERIRLKISKKNLKRRDDLQEQEKSRRRKKIRNQLYKLLKQQQKYDCALIMLEKRVVLEKYPVLDDARSFRTQKIMFCDLREKIGISVYPTVIEPQIAYISKTATGGMFTVRSYHGMSGSGVFMFDNKQVVIGIYKGYDKRQGNNICTLFNRDVILKLQKWVSEFFMFRTNIGSGGQLNNKRRSSKSPIKQIKGLTLQKKVNFLPQNPQKTQKIVFDVNRQKKVNIIQYYPQKTQKTTRDVSPIKQKGPDHKLQELFQRPSEDENKMFLRNNLKNKEKQYSITATDGCNEQQQQLMDLQDVKLLISKPSIEIKTYRTMRQ